MNRIIIALLAFLTLIGCRTRKEVTNTEQKQVQKERFIKYKDSTALFQHNAQTLQLDTHALQEYEVTLESEKDSVGNAQEVTYYRIRDGDNETIRVSGGKVKITTKSSLSNSLIEAKATLTNTVIQRSKEERRISEAITKAYKTKEVKGMIMKWWWIAVVLLVVWIGWRYKLFRF
uniref:Protein involved in gliding motility 9 Secretion System Type.5A n=1 Tax=Siphoviridae sp. ctQEY27 TaxID=2826326 RepID=A0A8S5M533_9CAUD|nr:MAG TPA: Protein involved in gliding motility 9 Secretion System Type.5A [Siphoviridae sp. ctQEY27]